mgnify:CR=1 FL=1
MPSADVTPFNLSLEDAVKIIQSAGYEVTSEPETQDEKLERIWADFILCAQRIEALVSKGARLPAREKSWMMGYSLALVNRAAAAVAETSR